MRHVRSSQQSKWLPAYLIVYQRKICARHPQSLGSANLTLRNGEPKANQPCGTQGGYDCAGQLQKTLQIKIASVTSYQCVMTLRHLQSPQVSGAAQPFTKRPTYPAVISIAQTMKATAQEGIPCTVALPLLPNHCNRPVPAIAAKPRHLQAPRATG